jgi:hypothetical protein
VWIGTLIAPSTFASVLERVAELVTISAARRECRPPAFAVGVLLTGLPATSSFEVSTHHGREILIVLLWIQLAHSIVVGKILLESWMMFNVLLEH